MFVSMIFKIVLEVEVEEKTTIRILLVRKNSNWKLYTSTTCRTTISTCTSTVLGKEVL